MEKDEEKQMLKELLDTWYENERKSKEKNREILDRLSKVWMLNELEEINDRMDAAVERIERNRKKREQKNQKRGGQ